MAFEKNTQKGHVISTGNSTTSILASGATFTGAWEDVTDYATVATAVLGSVATSGTLYFDLSTDGGSTFTSVPRTVSDTTFELPRILNVVETHVRIRYVNGDTAMTGTWSLQTKYSNGQQMTLLQKASDTIGDNTDITNVRSIGTGRTTNGDYLNQVMASEDNGNSSTTNLTSGTSLIFTGAWTSIESFAGISVLVDGTASGAVGGTLEMQFSHDAVTVNRNISVSNTDITNVPPRTLGVVAKYFRVVYTADSDLTSFDCQTMLHTEQVSLVSRLDQTLQGTEDITLHKSVIVARQPAGTWKDDPANGVAISTSGTLASGASYTSAWIDSHGYSSLEAFITSDVVSSEDGIEIEFTDDLTTETVRETQRFTFDDTDILKGFKNIFVAPKLVGFRFKFTNGVTAQTDFLLQVDVKTNGIITKKIDERLSGDEDITLVRTTSLPALDIARGKIDGEEAERVFGINDTVGTTFEDLYPNGGNYPFPSGAAKVGIASSSTADTSASSGARSVIITGLDASGIKISETIATSGTTEVDSVNEYFRILDVSAAEVGTYGGANMGDIDCRVTSSGSGTGDILGIITGEEGAPDVSTGYGLGCSFNGIYTVPSGKVMYVTKVSAIPNVATNKTVTVALYKRENAYDVTAPFTPRQLVWIEEEVSETVDVEFESKIRIPALTDVWFRVLASATSKITASFEFYLLDEDALGN